MLRLLHWVCHGGPYFFTALPTVVMTILSLELVSLQSQSEHLSGPFLLSQPSSSA
jgi:hypothetical protein